METEDNQISDDDVLEHNSREELLLLNWEAPSRPYKKHDREYFTTIGAIVFILSLILFFAGQFLFIAVLISLAFVSYVLAAVPPEIIQNSITTFGIHIGDQLFYWEELNRFWFTKKYKSSLMHVETKRTFPAQIILIFPEDDKDQLKKIMLKHIVFDTPKNTWLDNAANWMTKKFPLEKDES